MRPPVLLLACLALFAIAGCGGSDTTTVIKEAQPTTVERTTTVQAPPARTDQAAASSEAEFGPSGEPPDVVGLPLPDAKRLLREAGYRAAATNTDTTFGIIVESNYTICTQDQPKGELVPVLAQKYGC